MQIFSEISNGGVLIKNNTKLCFMDTIKWTEVTYSNSRSDLSLLGSECPQCGPNCNSCWSEDTCQSTWKTQCTQNCSVGCTSNRRTCCDPICASGCYGRRDECVDCRNFSNEGKCVANCPSLEKYNHVTMKNEADPQGRYTFGNKCVKQCPKNTIPCQEKCEVVCLEKDSEKILCSEASLVSQPLESLRNCSVIAGPLKLLNAMISNREPPIVPLLDNNVMSVRNITDSLVIQGKHKKFIDLTFLKNLEVIQGLREDSGISLLISHTSLRALNLTSLHTILNGDVWISDNDDLETLDLVSLKSVEGFVTIRNNKNLCFVEKSLFENIAREGYVFVGENKDPELCKKENKTCHEECFGGCWGPGNKQCRFCKHFLFQGECLPSCGFKKDPLLYEEDGECKKCHHQCIRNCTGAGPFNCTECKNAKNNNECVENCPPDKYLNATTKICSPCHPNCKGGCSGPSADFGTGGCNDCRLLYHKENKCVDDLTFQCTSDKYKKIEDRTKTNVATGKHISVCYDCHPMCKTCTGEGVACECRYVKLEGACIESCPRQHYVDADNVCQKCHQECDDCQGSTADVCFACKNVRIYLNVTLHVHNISTVLNSTEFVCNSTCPSHMSASKDENVDGHIQKICYYSDELFQVKRKAMIGLLVLVGIGVICAAVVTFAVRKRQKAKTEENEAKMQAQIEGINAYELLTPSKVRPESLTSLRLIKEAELNKNEEIGSGNFGIVYRGIWHPENEKIRVPVAIKVLTARIASAQNKNLLEEAKLMASVSHPCCIRMLAVCLSRQMMLVTPLVAHGSMTDYLQRNGNKLGSHTMLKWASQIARGMNYLVIKGIVHRNLAARNILIQSVNQVKIADAMIPKIVNLLDKDDSLETDEVMPKSQIPIKWLSLESIQYNIFTHKSDVWSYGITLWELFTYGEKPYKDVSAFDIAEHLEMGERLPQPSICTIDVYMVMIKCWMADANSRPSFQELEEEFCGMARDPGRFLVIHGDKLMRVPSDYTEDNRLELIRQMNLSDSDDIVCGEDYLSPPSFTYPYRTFSEKYNKLTSVQEEEETSFQMIPEYNNLPSKSSRPSFKHQSSSVSSGSGSMDGTFTHLEAASVALEGSRRRKTSTRYLGSPSSESSSGDLMNFPQTPRPPSLDEKEVMKLDRAYANKVKGDDYCEPKNKKEDYLEPQTKMDDRIVKNTGIFLDNPEYMSQLPNNNFLPSMYQK